MARPSVGNFQMHIGAGAGCEAVEKILQKLSLQIANAHGANRSLENQIRPSTEVDSGHGKSLIPRHQKVASTVDPFLRSERLAHGFTQRDHDVFDGVVLIHVKIAARAKVEIESAVTGEKLQHVIEKADAGGNSVTPAAIEVQSNLNVRLRRRAMERCSAPLHSNHPVVEYLTKLRHGLSPFLVSIMWWNFESPCNNRRICAFEPIVKRR